MTTTPLRIGIIGYGKIGAKHLAGYAQLPDVEVVVTDADASRKGAAEQAGLTWIDSPEALIADPSIDAVDICTPTHTHADYAIAALDSGKHVFCEKPLTDTTAKARAVIEAEKRSGKIVMLGHIFKFHPAFRMLKDILDQGVLGSPHFGLFRIGGFGSHQTWKHRKDSCGGVLFEMMVHVLDLALWYFGQPAQVDTYYHDVILKTRRINGGEVAADAEDICLVRLGMDSGATVICESDFVSTSYMNVVEVHGSNGSMFTSIVGDVPTILTLNEARGDYPKGRSIHTFEPQNLFVSELGQFVDCIRNGHRPDCNQTSESLDLLKVVEAIGK